MALLYRQKFLWWLLLLTLPIERLLVWKIAGFTFRPSYIVLMLLALTYDKELRNLRWRSPFIILSCISLLPAIISISGTFSMKYSVAYLAWAGFTVLTWLVVFTGLRTQSEKMLPWLVHIYTTSAAIWALFTLGQWLGVIAGIENWAYSWVGNVPRVAGLTYEPSDLVFYLLPPLAWALVEGHRWQGLLIGAAVILSTARTGFVGLVILALGVLMWRRGRLILASGVILGMILLSVVPNVRHFGISPSQAPSLKRLSQLKDFAKGAITLTDQSSTIPRLESWKDAGQLFLSHPWSGVGVGAYGYALTQRTGSKMADVSKIKTTNLWLEVAAEQGLPGLLALLIWALYPLWWVYRRRCWWTEPAVAWITTLNAVLYLFVQTWWRPYLWWSMALIYEAMATREKDVQDDVQPSFLGLGRKFKAEA